jgi:mevalonate kinase
MEEEEYEVIPTSPLRRIEKRINKLEDTSSSSETRRLIEQIIELIKSNQRVIDDIIKSDAELRNEVSKIPGKVDELLNSMNDFIEMLKTTAGEETVAGMSKEMMSPLLDKMGEFVEQTKKTQEISQATLASLGVIDKRLKRMYLQAPSSAPSRRYAP